MLNLINKSLLEQYKTPEEIIKLTDDLKLFLESNNFHYADSYVNENFKYFWDFNENYKIFFPKQEGGKTLYWESGMEDEFIDSDFVNFIWYTKSEIPKNEKLIEIKFETI